MHNRQKAGFCPSCPLLDLAVVNTQVAANARDLLNSATKSRSFRGSDGLGSSEQGNISDRKGLRQRRRGFRSNPMMCALLIRIRQLKHGRLAVGSSQKSDPCRQIVRGESRRYRNRRDINQKRIQNRNAFADRMRCLQPRHRSVVWIETWPSRNCICSSSPPAA
jgi:hypothetical protein